MDWKLVLTVVQQVTRKDERRKQCCVGYIIIQTAKHTMTKKITVLGALAALTLASNVQDSQAFAPASFVRSNRITMFAEEGQTADAVFVPPETDAVVEETKGDEEISLEAAEMLGRGAAKVGRHGTLFFVESKFIISNCCNFDSH